MKKILLVDDRKEEQNRLFEEFSFSPVIFDEILDIMDFSATDLEPLLNDKRLEKYCCIIIHQSIFKSENRTLKRKMLKLAREESIDLVFFSGNISTPIFKDHPKRIDLPRLTVYTNLKMFLLNAQKGKCVIEILAYGGNWRLNMLRDVQLNIKKILRQKNLAEKPFNPIHLENELMVLTMASIDMPDENHLKEKTHIEACSILLDTLDKEMRKIL